MKYGNPAHDKTDKTKITKIKATPLYILLSLSFSRS